LNNKEKEEDDGEDLEQKEAKVGNDSNEDNENDDEEQKDSNKGQKSKLEIQLEQAKKEQKLAFAMKLWTFLQLLIFTVLSGVLHGKLTAEKSLERMILAKVNYPVMFPREFQTDLAIAYAYESIL